MFGKKNSKELLNHRGRSVIGETMQIEGEMHSSGGMEVFGLINGNVYVKDIDIFETGSVKGDVYANEIKINGHMEGQIFADVVSLGSKAIVIGDISFKTALKTEEGAEIDGYIKKTKKIAKEIDLGEFNEKPELGKPTLVNINKK